MAHSMALETGNRNTGAESVSLARNVSDTEDG